MASGCTLNIPCTSHDGSPVSLGMLSTAANGGQVHVLPVRAEVQKDSIRINMQISLPPKKEKPKPRPKPSKQLKEASTLTSMQSPIFVGPARSPQPEYFQEIDCVGLPDFFTAAECLHIIEAAEARGFSRQHRHSMLQLHWVDIFDPALCLCKGIWQICGLGPFLEGIMVDGMVPCGLNDIVRIQKYTEGELFGQHRDQSVRREDGRVSKYSLRVFLNEVGEDAFQGGGSAFHTGPGAQPVVFQPEVGLALLYPQGDPCPVQEELKVVSGCKYVLRTDVLFCYPDAADKFRAAAH